MCKKDNCKCKKYYVCEEVRRCKKVRKPKREYCCYTQYDFNNCYDPCYDPCRPNPCPPAPPTYVNTFGANLTGAQEVPPNGLTATGRLVGVLSLDNTRFDYVLHTTGLTNITAAHFHLGALGQTGPAVKTIPINPATGNAIGSWTTTDPIEPLTPALINALKSGQIYVNVHTTQFPDGAIRGQVYPLLLNNGNNNDYVY
ncbi:CHRD domain protein [Tupanvirus deep ocean]|uniref:CHRD domain protein n=2 Tax=Tupanvirus TaxID=2094720 RepID=A0AC62A9X1_9VIRU|nr:CHRD domain protein [Tupanvirus deep ocean]QKU34438.1 CHRD domain protein [Tupanvirus deep ocean]